MVIVEIAPPPLSAGGLLVEATAAAISVGTETGGLRLARQSTLGQLVSSPSFRQRVAHSLQAGTFGPAVRRRLGRGTSVSPPSRALGAPTGYSCAGRVMAVGETVQDARPGDRVACAGSPHAEIISVPQNLFVPIPDGVSDVEASFVALGSVALHSLRQAELTCGETVVVIGLGVIGQLVEQLARVHGARTIATDMVPGRLEVARRLGAHLALSPVSADIVAQTRAFTDGLGADAVILCMGGESAEPIRMALDLVRDRGRLIVVGTPRLDIPRAMFYQKEVELRIARSYGPGRYDPRYEEQGHDYPVSYVRWTERRNMAEFLRLLSEKRVSVEPLITHRLPFDQAPQAYEAALGDPQATLGIVLVREGPVVYSRLPEPPALDRRLGVAVIGAGSFARAYHLPNIARTPGLELRAIVTGHQSSAERAASEFGASLGTTKLDAVLTDPTIDLVVIATQHHLHALQAIAALEAGKAVFCEKPMGMNRMEVNQVVEAVQRTGGFYTIGFNRRFAPTVIRAKELLAGRRGPLVLNYRVMGAFLPADHWVHDPTRGGGSIVGEACHFFDLVNCLVGSEPARVTAVGGALSHPGTALIDNVVCMLEYEDGSVASVVYGDLGKQPVAKERLEIFAGEGVLVLDDFRELRAYGFSGQQGVRLATSDKGHRAEMEAVARARQNGSSPAVSARDGQAAMACAFDVVGQLQRIKIGDHA